MLSDVDPAKVKLAKLRMTIARPDVHRGFTIVELLVVIVVIAILAAVSMVAYSGIQNRAATTVLMSDLRNAATQLGLLYAQEGHYPLGPTVPSDLKAADNNTFEYTSDGEEYCLTATTTRRGVSAYNVSSSGSLSEGACPGHRDGGGGVAQSCPEEFVPIPGNSHYGTSGFCAMKYEAKNVGGTAISQAAGGPWASISQSAARTAAQGACDGCRLMTEAEWMTIATDVLGVGDNWSGGSIGSGNFPRGNSDNSSAMDGTAALSGINKRTLKLSNGEEIWDIAGNVWEWTDATITGGQPSITGQGAGWKDYSGAIQWNGFPAVSQPTGALYSRAQGVGALYSNPSDSNVRAFARGGSWNGGDTAGVLSLGLDRAPTYTNARFGFRATR